MYQLVFELRGTPTTINSLMRAHWSKQAEHARNWRQRVKVAVKGKLPPCPLPRARIKLTRYAERSLDADNLVTSFKPVIDGLIDAGVLVDDKYPVIGMPTYQWEKCKRVNRRIKIEVEQCE